MHRKNEVALAVSVLLGALLTTGMAVAQEPQRVEVTGSSIKRTSIEGPSPLEVVTRKDIAKTGATTINELLSSLPVVDVFDQGELASNSPVGSGTANVKMRGLSESETLVLLNGRRLPVNGIYDSSGAGAAFDINTIPLSAIERIDILKDGASAIYGADAVAGVVNIITKSDYQGVDVTVGYGNTSRNDGTEKRAGITAGFGDLNKDRFNILVGLDVLKRDPIYRKDRDISKSVDFRRFGSRDGRSGFSPTGNIVDPTTGGFVGQTYGSCPPENLNAGICRYDFNASLLTAYNAADRVSGMILGSAQLTSDIKAFAELMYSRSENSFKAHPVPDYFNVPITDPSQTAYEDPNVPGTVLIAGRFMQGGPRISERKATLLNFATGLEGFTRGLDWKLSVGQGQSKVTNNDRNYYDAAKWVAATSSGLLNPTVDTNDPAFVEGLKVNPSRVGKSTIQYINAQVGGDAFALPAGPLRYAVGASVLREKLVDTPDPLTQAGDVVGSIAQSAVDASRNVKAVFGELQIPVLKNLEGQLALRHDRYPNASATSPKVALKYNPIQQLAFRASYTESFRAPVLKQLYGAQEQGAITITDDEQCQLLGLAAGCTVNAFQVNGSNADLKPEKGKTYNFGVILDLNQNFNASVDFWKIKKTNGIDTPTIADAVRAGRFTREGARFFIFTNLQNLAERETAGVDLDMRLRLPRLAFGDLTFRNVLTYYSRDRKKDSADGPWKEYSGTYALPRFRNTFQASVESGPWAVTASVRTTGGFWDQDEEWPLATGTRRVGTHEELDVQAQYGGFKNWTVTAGIKNLLDRMPPFSATNATDNQYTQMGFAELYSARGRYFYLSANYSFN